MSITKKFCEVERGLIVGLVSIDGETGNILSTGNLEVNSIETNSGVLIHASGNMDVPGEVTIDDLTTVHSLHVLNNTEVDGSLSVLDSAHISGDLTVNGIITTNSSFDLLNKTVNTINFGGDASQINIGASGDNWVITNSNLEVTRNLIVGYQFEVAEGKFQFDGTFGDQGATRLQGILEVGQQALFEDNVTVDASLSVAFNTDIGGYLNVLGNVNVNDKFTVAYVTGNTVIHGTQNTKGAVDLDSTLNVDGNTTLNGTLHVVNEVDFDSTLNVDGTLNVEGATVIDDTLQVTGAVDFDNNLNVDGTLNVEGATVIDDTLNVTGNTDLDGTLNVDGNVTLRSTLEVTSTISGSSTISDAKGEVRLVPQNEQASSYTLVASDHGKHILASNTVTVPGNIFSAGQTVVVINWTGGNITLSQGASMTMYQVGTSNTGNRTIAQRGLVTLFFINATNCIVSGSGLS
jgi:cytoskeletal protein CcmA (bactofilin family)